MRNHIILLLVGLVAAQSDMTLEKQVNEVDVLVKRQTVIGQGVIASNICGWLGGEVGQPWVCLVASYSCILEPKGGFVGCCPPNTNSCGAFRTACYPQTAVCDSKCQDNPQNLVCDTDYPLCATYTYSGNAKEFRCENTIKGNLSVEYTYSGFSTPIQLPREISGYTTTKTDSYAYFPYSTVITITQTPPSAAPTTTIASSTSNSKTSLVSSASSSATSQPSSGSSTPTGAIVGGVIGGIAAISLLVAVFFWIRYRKRAAERARSQESYPITGMPQQGYERKDNADVHTGLMGHSPLVEAPGHYTDTPQGRFYASELPAEHTWSHPQQ